MGDFLASTTWAHLGWANLALGRWEQAADDLAVGVRVSSTSRFWERPLLLIGFAFAKLRRSDIAAGRRLLDEAGAYVAERAIRLHDPDLLLGAGLVALAEQDVDQASAAFERAERLATELGRPLLARDIAAARCELARRSEDHEQVERHLERGRALSQEVAASIADEQLRNAFLRHSAEILEQRRTVTGSSGPPP
jgi:tetratricopeptide (TPR) repeat protein